MKRRVDPSMRTTRLISQRSSTDPAVTLFKLENIDDEPGPSSVRRSKRAKVEITDRDADDGEPPVPASEASTSKAKRTRAQPRSDSKSASPRKPKAIKQALDEPHPAPPHWRETYDAIKEMRARFPAPVDTMGCDTAKWKETDPQVRGARSFLID
jgi:endonuclease III